MFKLVQLRHLPFAILGLFLLDLISLIWVGQRFGVMVSLFLMLIGIFVGFKLIKQSGTGFSALLKGQSFSGQTPQQRVAAKFLQAISGILFILPGFISDGAGLILLLPFSSKILAGLVPVQFTAAPVSRSSSSNHGPIIEGEIIAKEDDVAPKHLN